MTSRPEGRQRLDTALVERGLAESRARAQELITSGNVRADGIIAKRPAMMVEPNSELALVNPPPPFVSRGGIKLRHALDCFDVSVAGVVALDVGASTGGFTDALLQAGARRVFAVDVGYGQLAWSLRTDPRVVVMERTNIRELEGLPEPIDLAVADVSFISLRHVFPVVTGLVRPNADCIVLIKPQFEAGRESVGRKGVVRDPLVWRRVINDTIRFAADDGWVTRGLTRSPITGPAGNVEFLLHLSNDPGSTGIPIEETLDRVIQGR